MIGKQGRGNEYTVEFDTRVMERQSVAEYTAGFMDCMCRRRQHVWK